MATIRKREWVNSSGTQVAWVADYHDQHKKRHLKTFPNRRAAVAWLAETVLEVKHKVHTPASSTITVAEAADLWLDKCEHVDELHSATLTQYRNHVRLHIVKAVGGEKLSEFRGPEVEQFKDGLLRGGMSRTMAQKVMVSLKAILANAKRLGKVTVNHATDVKLPKRKNGERRKQPKIGETIPTKDELNAALDKARDTRWYPMLLTAALAGLRSSEIRALRWANVSIEDINNAYIHVVERADEKNDFDAPKSEAGTRKIPIQSLLAKTLQRWHAVCPPGALDLVFPTGIGTVETHANMANRGWYAAQVAAGVTWEGGAKYGFHSLRHFAAALWIEQNHLPKRVQELMGHSSLQMTYDTYGALFPVGEDERAKMEEAASFLHVA
jgi:integrase